MQGQLYSMEYDSLVLLIIVISAAIVVPIAITNPLGKSIKRWQFLLVLGVGVIVSIAALPFVGLLILLVMVHVTSAGR